MRLPDRKKIAIGLLPVVVCYTGLFIFSFLVCMAMFHNAEKVMDQTHNAVIVSMKYNWMFNVEQSSIVAAKMSAIGTVVLFGVYLIIFGLYYGIRKIVRYLLQRTREQKTGNA